MRRRNNKLLVTEEALIHMVLSAVEVYPNECLGLLLGDSSNKVVQVYVLQNVERSTEEVIFDMELVKMLKIGVEKTTSQRVIGSFHSHCGENALPYLSEEDKNVLPFISDIAVVVYLPYLKFDWKVWKGGQCSVSQRWRARVFAWRIKGKRIYKLPIRIVRERDGDN